MMFKKIAAILLVGVALAACSKVPAGHVGVKVYLLGSSKGVDSEELPVGRYWIGINEELYLFPTFTQNYVWTKDSVPGSETDESITFQTKEGMSVNADVGISYRIDPTKVTGIFQKYRKGVDEITDLYLRNMVRDALVTESSTLPIDAVYGAGKTALMEAVSKRVSDQVSEAGIIIEKIYWIGNVRLPENVIDRINEANAATQKAIQRQNEVAEAEAEARKRVATAKGEATSILEVAKAQAEANRVLAESLTPELVRYKALEKWDGTLPKMTGSNAIPFVDVSPDLTGR
jgi:regulator of protease activity HflC (stomatin/prohibitin superfamily)